MPGQLFCVAPSYSNSIHVRKSDSFYIPLYYRYTQTLLLCTVSTNNRAKCGIAAAAAGLHRSVKLPQRQIHTPIRMWPCSSCLCNAIESIILRCSTITCTLSKCSPLAPTTAKCAQRKRMIQHAEHCLNIQSSYKVNLMARVLSFSI